MAMLGVLRKLCSASSTRPFSSSSSPTTPLLLIPNLNLFSGEKNGELADTSYPYCLSSLADMAVAGGGGKKKTTTRVLLPKEELLRKDKKLFFSDDLRYIGSSHGWVGCVNPRNLKMFVFDPLSPSGTVTVLPNLPDLKCPEEIKYCKLVMSAPPNDPTCTVLALSSSDQLFFWTPGDRKWTPLPYPNNCYGETDIHYSDRRRRFHVTYGGAVLVAWDLSNPVSPKSATTKLDYEPPERDLLPEHYLAESPSSGDLLLIWKSLYAHLDSSPEHLEHEFIVYKLDSANSKWIEDESGDFSDALFLGKNDGFGLSRRDFPARSSSIYFTENFYLAYSQFNSFDPDSHGGCDVVVYENGKEKTKTSRFYFRDSKKKSTELTPIWVLPSRDSSMASLVERSVVTCEYKPLLV